ncbi:MAG: amidase [Acidobacteriota bacterium]|nr:amidase [Acidobacteriota bacterium]
MTDSKLIARRALMKLAPALAVAAQSRAQNPPAAPPDVVTNEMLRHSLTMAGLEFTDAQLAMMLPEMNRNLVGYRALRNKDVPLDTEPAIHFRPNPPRVAIEEKHAFRPSRLKSRPSRPASMEDLAFAPVTRLAPLLKAKKVTSVELTAMYLARLKRYAPKLNCVITMTEDLAMAQAQKADAEIRRGHYRGPLHGVPYGAKDLFNTKGIRTTWGAEPYQNTVPDTDATAITRLTEAGAVLLAKLSMGALAQGGLWFGGMTKNPWNTEQTSSGSSAGSASATSAGLVGFSIGTETLGSIVSPSTRCGVTGLRPTYGRVSRYGAMGLSWTMDKIGPICRSVEDCALVLHSIYGPDGNDSTVRNVPLAWNPALPLANLRVGFLKVEFDRQTGESKDMYAAALAALEKAGAKLQPVELPALGAGPLRIILTAEAATAFDDITRNNRVDELKGQTPNDWPNTFRSARTIPAVEYIRAQRERTLLMGAMDRFMSNWDVLVSPTGSATLLVTNLTGHPQVTVPCGFVDKTPAGLLFTGPLYQEGVPLRAALAFEQTTDWHNMHPKVDW